MLAVAQVAILLTALYIVLLVLLHMLKWVRSQLYLEAFIASLAKVKQRYYT
jgi:hypothetical protein